MASSITPAERKALIVGARREGIKRAATAVKGLDGPDLHTTPRDEYNRGYLAALRHARQAIEDTIDKEGD